MLKPLRVKGFTLIEILVAVTISSFLLIGLVTFFVTNMQHNQLSFNLNRFNQQLYSAMDFMVDEIRRAGYWANANTDIGLHQNNNPFMTNATDISVGAGQNCILFTYDKDNNGTLPTISSSVDDERYGFQLRNGAVQTRPPGAGFACGSTDWENITDPNVVTITNLTFTLNTSSLVTGPGTKGIIIRSVDISLTGQLVSDPSITKTITQHVRIRNDKFIP